MGESSDDALERSRRKYQNGYYKRQLKQGQEFEDYVATVLYGCGIPIMPFTSKLYQQTRGENMLGAEVKKDTKFGGTGNLFIETAEKSHPDRPEFVPSGIDRQDNTWLYVIGDESCVWIFSKTLLRLLRQSGRYTEKEIPTSQGFLLPVKDADKYAAKKVIPADL